MSAREPDAPKKAVGYRRPPASSRFEKGKSGNPKGRPPGRHRGIPYESVLGQKVTIREDGKERRVTAAEAFLLQLTRKGLQGDNAAARASLEAIEAARAKRGDRFDQIDTIRVEFVDVGPSIVFKPLGLAVKLNEHDSDKVRWRLQPWIVEAALARLGPRRLNVDEQREVWGATHKPLSVHWPDWWTEHRPPDRPEIARRRRSDADL